MNIDACKDATNPFARLLYTEKEKIKNIETIDSAIETGTHTGLTATAFAKLFKNVFTIEKYPQQNNPYTPGINLSEEYKKIKEIYNNILFFTGNSPVVLAEIFKSNPATRFVILLDAHSSDHSPIIDELNSIKIHSNVRDHVIIVDDMIDIGSAGWPSYTDFENTVKSINSNYKILQTSVGRNITLIYAS